MKLLKYDSNLKYDVRDNMGEPVLTHRNMIRCYTTFHGSESMLRQALSDMNYLMNFLA